MVYQLSLVREVCVLSCACFVFVGVGGQNSRVGYPEEEAKKRDWKQSKGIVLYFKTDRADFTPI
ncbi:MAG: hypothetical protein EAZ95_12880 [Bacteroidetes bacterium]|nr:MAG: hypothetical protein EAZ95_12880 [Bacteroidota bacterium]